jgi:hypothetical protein
MPKTRGSDDPFLGPRDAGEEAAGELIREFLIRASPPALIYRQAGAAGYALIVPRLQGARLLTVPGLNEADFMSHGNQGTTAEQLADFIARKVCDSQADHLKLPLLTRRQAERLRHGLAERLPEWRIAAALASVAPLARGVRTELKRLRRAVARAERDGLKIDVAGSFPADEIRALHGERWGDIRSDSFFRMLAALMEQKRAELVTVRNAKGSLFAAQLDIIGSAVRHQYFTVSDTRRAPGSGTAALGVSWRRFLETEGHRVYSFGRGTERYKFQFANACRELFEVRGFLVPRTLPAD